MVFRLGTEGRPTAIVTCELYGSSKGNQFALNHEFLAIEEPKVHINRDGFIWRQNPGTGAQFQKLKHDQAPAVTARAFVAIQTVGELVRSERILEQ